MTDNVGRSFTEDIGENAVELQIGNGQTILRTVLFACGIVCEFYVVAYKVTKLTDVGGRNKAAGNKVVLENVGNPLSILFFLPRIALTYLGCARTILQSDSRML